MYSALSTALNDLRTNRLPSITCRNTLTFFTKVLPEERNVNFIIKWIDYSNKYGLGYQLRDGTVGVHFNDATSIVLAKNGK